MSAIALRALLGACLCLISFAALATPHALQADALDSLRWDDPSSAPASLRIEALSLGVDEPAVDLLLERSHPFASNSKLRVDGQWLGASQSERIYYRGAISGEPWSIVSISVGAEGDMRGLLSSHGGYWRLGTATSIVKDNQETRHLFARFENDVSKDRSDTHDHDGFECGVDHHIESISRGASLQLHQRNAPVDPALALGPSGDRYRVRVAFESDYSFYQMFEADADPQIAAQEYLGDLMNYTSAMYINDLNTEIVISSISLWSSPASQPWQELGDTLCLLYEMGIHWNDPENSVDNTRTLAHFVAGNSTANGGIAWLSVLCRGAFDIDTTDGGCNSFSGQQTAFGDYGVSGGLSRSFDPDNPQPSVWDFVVVAHELGHNFSSPHTHCYDSPVDECRSGEGASCYNGPQSLPGPINAGAGTIMSYCHLLPGGLNNIAPTLGFEHPFGSEPYRVPLTMRNHVVNRGALTNPRCPVSVADATQHLARTQSNAGGQLSPSYRIVDSGDIATFTVQLEDGASLVTIEGCDGSLAENTYTTSEIQNDCVVTATFELAEYMVTAQANGPGSVTPESSLVTHGGTTSFTLTPNPGAEISSANGCGGTLSGQTFTTGAITAACTVTVAFETTPSPVIELSNSTINATLSSNSSGTQNLNISNQNGDAELSWMLSDAPFLTEGFDSVGDLASNGWVVDNRSAPLGTSSWAQGATNVFTAHAGPDNAYINANFNNAAGTGTISNWLLTPEIPLTAASRLQFFTRTVESSTFPDRLEVRLSSNGASTNVGDSAESVGDFTTVLDVINPELLTGGYPADWTEYSLPANGSGTGRIAFRYYVTNGGPSGSNSNFIGLDTVSISGCDNINDIAWLSIGSDNGTVASGQSSDLELGFDSTGLAVGEYSANLCFSSNDPVSPLLSLAVSLTVSENTLYSLDVSRTGNGSGIVSSAPAGIDCGTSCSASFAEDTEVSLSANAATGSAFAGWSGGCSGTGSCTVTMSQARNVTADFALREYTVDTSVSGPGSIDPGSATVTHGSSTSFTLSPNPGAEILSTSGCGGNLTGSTYTTSAISGPCTVQAQFGSMSQEIFRDRFER